MILIDSGYLIALAVERDALHERATRWAEEVRDTLLLSEYVLWESVNYLSGVADRFKAHDLAEHSMSNPACEFVRATPELFHAGMAFHRARSDKDWSLTDCISFYLMARRGMTEALAFDEHFEQAGFVALLRREPQGAG